MEYSLTSSANKYVQIAKAFGEDTSNITVVEAAIKAIEGVRKLLYDLKIPQKLSDLELDKDELYNAAKIARSYEFLHFLPRPVSQEDLYNILLSAY
jgi:alcohol dehydrogenase class IV